MVRQTSATASDHLLNRQTHRAPYRRNTFLDPPSDFDSAEHDGEFTQFMLSRCRTFTRTQGGSLKRRDTTFVKMSQISCAPHAIIRACEEVDMALFQRGDQLAGLISALSRDVN